MAKKQINKSPVSEKVSSVNVLMSFTDALIYAISHRVKLCKRSWNDEESWIFFNDGGLLQLRTSDGKIHNLIVSEADFVGDDWFAL